MKKYFAVFSMVVMSACASVPMTTPEQDLAAKQFPKAPSDKSNLYIFRDEGMGGAVPMTVGLDNRILGKTASLSYFFLTIDPGAHQITSEAENTDVLDINTSAGEEYYVWQEVKMGFLFARTKLHLVPQDRGQRGVLRSKRIIDQSLSSE
ncbi:DUF2846 domain-containing protein [Magnetovibrio blakemorei]|uniref:DUF2846 domain-containing protein n=1 Tax=Magnetovibrio blakemorei TaxID=28181 RepID=A0A1E5Q7W1_9PROT|nr:DUF2846 domain-containing protein [Magnetovibrio blakemorei]OEJ67138.1 hypothetical protein BEN30_10190 [Magnetovibrio blakemorei]